MFSFNSCLDKGYLLIAVGSNCSFKKGGKVFLIGVQENTKLFKLFLKVRNIAAIANFSEKTTSATLA